MRVIDDDQVAAAASGCARFPNREILAAFIGVPAVSRARILRHAHAWKDPLILGAVDQVADIAAEVEREARRVRALHHLLLGMPAQVPAGKQDARKAALGTARRQVDDRPLARTLLDAFEDIRQNVVVAAMDVAGPDLANVGDEALAGQLRIAGAFACEKAKAVRNALALLGREAAVVEVARVIPEAFGLVHGPGTNL